LRIYISILTTNTPIMFYCSSCKCNTKFEKIPDNKIICTMCKHIKEYEVIDLKWDRPQPQKVLLVKEPDTDLNDTSKQKCLNCRNLAYYQCVYFRSQNENWIDTGRPLCKGCHFIICEDPKHMICTYKDIITTLMKTQKSLL
jgi:hypothetical protein